jgi:feruloyl esterase
MDLPAQFARNVWLLAAGTAFALGSSKCGAPRISSRARDPAAFEKSDSLISACNAGTAQAAAPPGVKIGPVDDLNPQLPAAPTGAVPVPASGTTPAYCLVTGSVITNPTVGKTANFGVALPFAYTGKFLFSGCAGFCGVVFQSPPDYQRGGGYPADALAKGYAIAATDDGHSSHPSNMVLDATWALKAPGLANTEAVNDYLYRAVHVVSGAARKLVEGWYRSVPTRSYFAGCSGGGREGMIEVARYPTDFDGYVVGDPFFDVPGVLASGRAARALIDAHDAYMPPPLLEWVDRAILAACDPADGVEDRIIQNPGNCSFDPESLRCKPGDTTRCLNASQIDLLRAWFSAIRDEQGRVVGLGFSVSDISTARANGNNLFMFTESKGSPRDVNLPEPWGESTLKQPPAWTLYDQTLKYFVFRDAAHDSNRDSLFDEGGIVKDAPLALLRARNEIGRADDPKQLAPFVASARKLLLYHGYSDGFVTPFGTVRLYQEWARRVGGYRALAEHARLFMVPGMFHCGQGPGPNFFDALGAVEQWVEHDRAPDTLVGTKYEADNRTQRATRVMPLCAFPTQARYAGQGPMGDAASWSCATNEDLLQVGDDGGRAGLDRTKR